MRKLLLGAAAAFAVAAPSIAQADSGEIGLGFGNVDISGFDDLDTVRLDAAFNHTMGNGLVLQADAAHDRLDVGPADLGMSYGAVSLGTRNDHHALYGWAGLSDVVSLSATSVGVGGQLYLGQATINGSVGFTDIDAADISVTNISVDGTYFFTDNLGLTAVAGHAEADDLDVDWTTLGVGGVWRFTDSPFTLNLGYRNLDFDGGEVDVWRLGFTYSFGSASEHDRSRTGASFNGAREAFENAYVIIF